MDNIEKKYLKFDEVVKLIQQAVKEPEHSGEYADYAELCKLYDKNDNGTMMLAELDNILSNMGDMINREDTMKLLDLLGGEEDEDGFIPYKPFLDKLCGKAPINAPAPQENYNNSNDFLNSYLNTTICVNCSQCIWKLAQRKHFSEWPQNTINYKVNRTTSQTITYKD